MNNRFMLVLIALVVGFVGIIWFSKSRQAAAPTTSDTVVTVTNHTSGAGNKGVTLVEYGDFECPACGAYYPIVEQVRQKFGDDITFQYRNFPLVQIHQHAMSAHRAAEAASKQGKFFEMYHLLYENQQAWKTETSPSGTFEGYAQELGLNVEQFKKDAASQEINDIINADIKAGQALGANSTPTFVINGKKVDENPRDLDSFNKLIQDAIDAKATQ